MEQSLDVMFDGNYKMITFNKKGKLSFLEKNNFIKNVTKRDDIVLFMEDDWECCSDLRLNKHVNLLLNNNDYSQVAFCDPFWVQFKEVKEKYLIDFDYWLNPSTEAITHPIKWIGEQCHWTSVSIGNFTLNPSLIKAEIYHDNDIEEIQHFESDFASKVKSKLVFTHDDIFKHIGADSLINKLFN